MKRDYTREEEFEEIGDRGAFDVREVLSRLKERWKFLLVMTIGGGVVAALIALAIPNMYTANALILPPTKPQSLSAAMMGQLGGMAAGAAAASFGLKDPNETYVGILKSRTVNDDLVDQFGLEQVYGKKTKEDARRKLSDRSLFALGRDSMIKISVEDRDPQRAAALANTFVAELNKQNNLLALTESAQRRMFFEREVQTEKNALTEAERMLQETQQRTGVVEVGSQSQLVMGSIARLQADIAMQEVSLTRLEMGATDGNPEVARQRTELSTLRAALSQLEAGGSRQRSGDPLVPLANVPRAGLQYLRALREVKYHDMLFEVLSKQYEVARIDEAKEAPMIQVVDPAVRPEKKSGPMRMQITVLGAILSALGGCSFVHFARGRALSQPPRKISAAQPVSV